MIVIVGITGSGKTTQGRLLADRLNGIWLSTGQLLRDTLSGDYAESQNRGELISDEVLVSMIDEKLKQFEGREVILDGSPRTMVQARWLVDRVKSGDISLKAIVHLIAPKSMVEERLLKRGRPDDTPDSIHQRFEDYDKNILPILDYLKQQGFKIIEVDASSAPETVLERIQQALNET